MPPSRAAVSSSPVLLQEAMSPAPTRTGSPPSCPRPVLPPKARLASSPPAPAVLLASRASHYPLRLNVRRIRPMHLHLREADGRPRPRICASRLGYEERGLYLSPSRPLCQRSATITSRRGARIP